MGASHFESRVVVSVGDSQVPGMAQPPPNQQGQASKKPRSKGKARPATDKFDVYKVPVQQIPTATTPTMTNTGAGTTMVKQNYYQATPYGTTQYQYYHNQQQQQPQYQIPTHPSYPNPLPYPNYYNYTSYSKQTSGFDAAQIATGTWQPMGGTNQQLPQQRPPPPKSGMPQSKEKSTKTNQNTQVLEQIAKMHLELRSMREKLERSKIQEKKVPEKKVTRSPAKSPKGKKKTPAQTLPEQTKLNVDKFNQLLDQFEKVIQGATVAKQQPVQQQPSQPQQEQQKTQPSQPQPFQQQPSHQPPPSQPQWQAPSHTMSNAFGATVDQGKAKQASELYGQAMKVMEELRLHDPSLSLNTSPCGPGSGYSSKPPSPPDNNQKGS